MFSGGWTLEAAEEIFGDDTPDHDMLDVLGSLVDKSLIRAEPCSAGGVRYAAWKRNAGWL